MPSYDANDIEAAYERMMGISGASMAFAINRPDGESAETTFSEDAMKGVTQQMTLFVGSRMMRHWQHSGKPPKSIELMVTIVTINGEPPPVEREAGATVVVDVEEDDADEQA